MATFAPTHQQPHHHHHETDSRPLSYWWTRAFVGTIAGIAFGFFVVWFFRIVFGMEPLWVPELYYTVIFGTATVG